MYRYSCVWLILLMTSLSKFVESQCVLFTPSSLPQDLASFLRASLDVPPQRRDSACIEFALRRLEYQSSEENAKLLVRYLDFARPHSEAERAGFAIHGLMTETNMHPAIGTLSTFGKTAVPALLSVIADPPSELVARYAIRALMGVFRDRPFEGIELLKSEASVSPPSKAAKFKAAAQTALQWCGHQYRQQCESAVRTNPQ
jgi:hypothetical protein